MSLIPESNQRRSIWLGLLALLWLVIVVAVYYVSHKPISPSSALPIASAIGHVIIAVAILSLAGGLGTRLLPEVRVSSLVAFAMRGALGAGLLSTSVLIVAGLVGTPVWLAWLGLVIPLLLLRRSVFTWWRGLAQLKDLLKTGGRLGVLIAVLCLLIFPFALLIALAPPLKFDALVYHLALPRQYLSSGEFEYMSGNIFWGMPQLAEMLYLWAMALGGEQAAACLGWGAAGLAVLGLLGYAGAQIGAPSAWVAVASLLAGYTLASAPAWAYADWFSILYGLVFLAAMHVWLKSGRKKHLVLAGVFAGFAFGSKYSAGALIAAGMVIIVYEQLRWAGLRSALVGVGIFSLAALAAAAPWLVKNLLATGNPLYPFVYPSGAMDAFRLDLYQGFPVWGGWKEVLLLPWQATMTGHEGAPGFSASIGPLILGLAPVYVLGLLFIKDPKLRRLQTAGSLALIVLIIWALASRLSGYLIQSRLYFVIFPALALLAGGGFRVLAGLRLPNVRLGRLAGSLVLLVLGLTTLQVGLDVLSKGAAQVVAGLTTQAEYLDTNLGWYAPAMRSILGLPANERALLLWEARSLYCLPRCQPDEVLDRWSSDLNAWGSSQRVLEAWRRDGFTHLLVYQSGADFLRREEQRYPQGDWQAMEQLLSDLPVAEKFGQAYTLYRLNP